MLKQQIKDREEKMEVSECTRSSVPCRAFFFCLPIKIQDLLLLYMLPVSATCFVDDTSLTAVVLLQERIIRFVQMVGSRITTACALA